MECYCMMKQVKQSSEQDSPWEVGDLVLVHGVHLAIVLLYHEPANLWLVRMMDGTELALHYEDLDGIKWREKNE